ncbi:hypothetical protein PHYSODRAFT_305390 [Phytophthora sojae]|uniref:Cas12f1-like TNB domain-containing protein n=1 Tax=Phytophthora sojae (strain P6497) TaxID=1094619 RepID=G5A377_PHYSP|nr:hypothetical protein PHYSODRAFT_305390 [Phytophthora sojae]EGZ10117.1 hypothetical protein PHYSODRAFT_305390 [Phytophthora sojae]|eukprot:XP_009534978.1 hypothetical protein PHYSODRAFT_305390 [Phytophthora sojae]
MEVLPEENEGEGPGHPRVSHRTRCQSERAGRLRQLEPVAGRLQPRTGTSEGVKEALARLASVVLVDEFRTSKLCSRCYQPLTEPYLPTRKNGSFAATIKRTKNVLCYFRSQCETFIWDRDVNAAHNIMTLPKDRFNGHPRRSEFARGV